MSILSFDDTLTVCKYLDNVSRCGMKKTGLDPMRSYTPIKILYDRDGYVSPLQKWNNILIDLDNIQYIHDAKYETDIGLWSGRTRSCAIEINIKFKVGESYSFKLAVPEDLGIPPSRNVVISRVLSNEEKQMRIHQNYKNSKGEWYVYYFNTTENCESVQKYIVDDLINVFRLYKEKTRLDNNYVI
jgi:hypothetical protein